MRKIALAGLLVGATALVSVPVIGLAGSTGTTGGPINLPLPRAAADEQLPAFDDCDELLDWYIEQALPLVGPWGFGSPYLYYGPVRDMPGFAVDEATGVPSARSALPQATADKAVGNSTTGTNVQEAGVDEPDLAKTDGRLIVRLQGRELIVTDIAGEHAKELSRTRLPKGVWSESLLLAGDTVLVLASGESNVIYADDLMGSRSMPAFWDRSVLLAYDISDPDSPELTSRTEFEGSFVETRQYDGTVRVVVQSGSNPPLDFVQPNGRRTEAEARRENREIVRTSTIEDWLPVVSDEGVQRPLVDCTDVRHPTTDSGLGTLTVVTFDAAAPSERETVAVTTSGHLAYSSTDRLYVATPVQQPIAESFWDRVVPEPPRPATTEIHAFALEGKTTSYAASGVVRGTVRDRWSFDEYDGNLRVATALGKNWETTDNAVSVLRESGSELTVVGSVRGIGPREEIQSVRWFDDIAVVVTFRQVDPLYTVDLSNPADPTVLGELKIPGFSSYLHPIGDDRLLGLGTAATKQGSSLGPQIATFDISRLAAPRQLDVLRLDRESELTATYDPHAFTFVGTDAIFTTVSHWSGADRIIRLAVAADGSLRETDEWPAQYQARVLPVDGDRVALVGAEVRLVDL
jgi:uncharacterized secreted protein with C-terminal beta-propeller domain